jgi:SAM-dependent methyltransferase
MRIAHDRLHDGFRQAQTGRASHHTATDRTRPSLFRYDCLSLRRLAQDIQALIEMSGVTAGGVALDLGSATSPYRTWTEARGCRLETFDIDPASGADHVGTGDDTGLPSEAFDLVICTQVLEHVPDPRRVLLEIHRILKPGGRLIASAPHVWFYHPHPSDYWRFTQEGVAQLCREADFELIELRAQGGSVLTLVQCVNFLLYGVLGRLGGPLYAVFNVLGFATDRLVPNDLFAHNFAWLARKPGATAD